MVRDFFEDIQIVVIYIELLVIWQLCIFVMASTWGKKGEKEMYGSVSAAIFAFLLCYSGYKLMTLIGIYVSEAILHMIGRISLVIGAFIFIFVLNWIFFKQIFKNTKFRRIYISTLILSAIFFVGVYYFYTSLQTLIILIVVIFIHVSIIGYFGIRWFISVGGFVKKYMLFFIGGAFLFILGASAARIIQFFPEIIYFMITTYFLEIGGILMMGIGIWGLPILSELDWKSKLIHLYVIYSNGLVVYENSFKRSEIINPAFVGSGLTGVVSVVKEMTQSDKRLSIIQQGDRNIVLEYGNYVTMALIVEEDLKMFHYKLKTLLTRFEVFFKEVLPNWKGGSTDVYMPTGVLIEQIFE